MINNDWQAAPKPLGDLTCLSYDCDNELHCFRRKRPKEKTYRNGTCINCDADLIDWDRLDAKDIHDSNYTIQSLNHELIRNHFWTTSIDDEAKRKAYKNGLNEIQSWAINRIERYVSKPTKDIFRDGIQTPKFGNIVYYGQHATGCCCRKCIEEWHGIDRNIEVTKDQIYYFSELIMLYAKKRLPDLPK
jgi:hypothetical protein